MAQELRICRETLSCLRHAEVLYLAWEKQVRTHPMVGNVALWKRIEAFDVEGGGDAYCFADRLSHENGWTRSFTLHAIDEYKKFVYLAAIAQLPVTPSDVVDQVWHLHLVYTRSYWEELCGGVLGKPLHHGPTKGGAREDRRYRQQYADTLALYRAEFECDAPSHIWPAEGERFAGAAHQVWVDKRKHFIVAKPSWQYVGTAVLCLGLVMFAGNGALAAEAEGDFSGIGMLVVDAAVLGALMLLIVISALSKKKRKKKNDGGADDGSAASVGFFGSFGGSSGKAGGGEGDGGSGCGSGCGGGGCGS